MANGKKIDLVLVLDANYENYATFLISQLIEFSPSEYSENFRFNILTFDDFFPNKLVSECGQNSASVRIFQQSHKVLGSDVPNSGHISNVAYLKLLIGDVLPIDVRKCIYLDVDILVNGETSEVFEQVIDQTSLIMSNVEPGGSNHHPSFMSVPEMFSAGFMILNLELWRNSNFSRVCLKVLHEFGPLPWADNDILILAMNELSLRCQPLDYVLHYIPGEYGDSQLAGRSPILVHFAGADKPWNSVFGGKYARTWRKRYRKYDPTFAITAKAYLEFFWRRISDLFYVVFMAFRRLKISIVSSLIK